MAFSRVFCFAGKSSFERTGTAGRFGQKNIVISCKKDIMLSIYIYGKGES